MKPSSAQVTALASHHPLFMQHQGLWELIGGRVHTQHTAKDTSIIHHGDSAESLWLVLRGWVKLTRQTPDGKETIVGLCTEGDVFGEASLFRHANYPYHAIAIGGEAELASIPAPTLRELLAKDSSLSQAIMAMLNQHMAQAQLKLEHMSTLSAAQRLGCFLLRLCHMQEDGHKHLQIPVEKHVLAAFLGMKPETLSRSQQQLKPIGVEVSGHQITVSDIGRLRDFVCNSCSESGSCETEAALED
jgi:CRP-like cAMP-binding protein